MALGSGESIGHIDPVDGGCSQQGQLDPSNKGLLLPGGISPVFVLP